ncbi:hypothetical protein CSM73_001962 [Salmonella enterica subsp. diarizonae]|nr:hypothetical protein [Salmonella enterica subsp. diarizonae]
MLGWGPPPRAVGGTSVVSVPARTWVRCKVGHLQPVHRAGGEQVMFLKEINTVV